MRDPGLLAGDLVGVAVLHRARLERGEVGAGVGLGEDGGRQHLAGRDLRQVLALLLVGAVVEDQLAGDLRAGAERADADVAARQLLRHDAHALLAEPEAAVLLRQRQAEHAELGHLGDDLERDVLVLQVPLVRVRHDLGLRELAHLLVDRGVRLVEAGVAEGGGAGLGGDELGKPRLDALARCRRQRASATSSSKRRTSAAATPSASGRMISTWLMGMPPAICARYSANAAARMQLLELAEAALSLRAALPQTCIWRRPSTVVASQARPCAACWASSMPPASATLARTPALADCSTRSAAATASAARSQQGLGAGRQEVGASLQRRSRHRAHLVDGVEGPAIASRRMLRCRIIDLAVKAIAAIGAGYSSSPPIKALRNRRA